MCHLGIAGVGTKAAQEINVENTGALSVPTTEGANFGGGAGEENVSVFNADNKTFFCFLILSTSLTFLLYAAEIFSHCCLWRCFVCVLSMKLITYSLQRHQSKLRRES